MDIRGHNVKFIVLTGGPGAGKTAVMEVARQLFCQHVSILPESASIVYGGGFPRVTTDKGIRSAQRAIVGVQRELEYFIIDDGKASIALCDRGIMDGAAYWPGGQQSFCEAMQMGREQIFARYYSVIHMRTPTLERGYNHSNPMRIESPEEASLLDQKIEAAWAGHPNRLIVDATESFTDKIDQVTRIIREALSDCCEHSIQAKSPHFASLTSSSRNYIQ
jgi:hypothetical protein